MIDMPVGEQHRDRPQPVPGHDLGDARLGVLARVDDQALRARLGGHQIAIGGKRAGWEPGDKHGPTSLGRSGQLAGCGIDRRSRLPMRSAQPRTGNSGVTTSRVPVPFAKFRW
jgi:hypothetical protein